MDKKDNYPNKHNHTKEPMPRHAYLAWHDWAKEMSKTHRQIQCPDCKLYCIWVKL
jgi:hypothetical protein